MTWIDLMLHTSGTTAVDVGLDDHDNSQYMTLNDLSTNMHEYKNLSENNHRMQEAVVIASKKWDCDKLINSEDVWAYGVREDVQKYDYDQYESFNEDAKVRDQDFADIKERIEKVFECQHNILNKHHGKVGVGKDRLELCGQEGGGYQSPLK